MDGTIMAKPIRPRSIQAKRFQVLIRRLLEENGNVQARVAELLSLEKAHFNRFVLDANKEIDYSTVERVLAAFEPRPGMGLDRRFFFDGSLGDAPDYRSYMRPKDATGTHEIPSADAPQTSSERTRVAPSAETMLTTMAATSAERKAFERVTRLFNLPIVDGTHVAVFLGTLRGGASVLEANDAAVNAAVDHAAEREAKRRPGDDE